MPVTQGRLFSATLHTPIYGEGAADEWVPLWVVGGQEQPCVFEGHNHQGGNCLISVQLGLRFLGNFPLVPSYWYPHGTSRTGLANTRISFIGQSSASF